MRSNLPLLATSRSIPGCTGGLARGKTSEVEGIYLYGRIASLRGKPRPGAWHIAPRIYLMLSPLRFVCYSLFYPYEALKLGKLIKFNDYKIAVIFRLAIKSLKKLKITKIVSGKKLEKYKSAIADII